MKRNDPYDPAGDSGDRGTPFITRDEMIEWLREQRPSGKRVTHRTAMIDAIIAFIDRNGR